MRGERARVGERLVNKPRLLRAQRGLAYFGRPLSLRRAWMLLLLLLFLASRHCVCIFYSHAFQFLAASHFLMFPFPVCVCVRARAVESSRDSLFCFISDYLSLWKNGPDLK